MGAGAKCIAQSKKDRRNDQPGKCGSQIVCTKRDHVKCVGNQHGAPPAQCIGCYSAWDLENTLENEPDRVKCTDLSKTQTLIAKKYQDKKRLKKTLIFQESVKAEFIVLPVFPESCFHRRIQTIRITILIRYTIRNPRPFHQLHIHY